MPSWRTARYGISPMCPASLDQLAGNEPYRELVSNLRAMATREAEEIDARIPKLLRRIGGYNIDTISSAGHNMARLLVGSEGTLAFFTAIELDLQPIPAHKVLGVCHFPAFFEAMEATRHIVRAGPGGGRGGGPHHGRAGPRNPGLPDNHREAGEGRARGASSGRVRRRRRDRAKTPPGRSRRRHGHPRLPRRHGERHRARLPAGRVGGPQGRPQHHDVHEGGRQTRLLHRGLCGVAGGPRRLHPALEPALRETRDQGERGTRMPPSAACTCARCST